MKFVLIFLLSLNLAYAEVITVGVKGMVCSFCSNGLLKRAEKNDKIEKASISLEKGELSIITKNMPVLDAEIEELVKEAGFEVKSIKRE